jgi:hypothetical protein
MVALSKDEIWFSLKVGGGIYFFLLGAQLLGGGIGLWLFGPSVRGLLAPGFVTSSLLLRLVIGARPAQSAGLALALGSVLNITILSAGVMLLRRRGPVQGTRPDPNLDCTRVGPGGTWVRRLKGALIAGFVAALLVDAAADLMRWPGRGFPWFLPGYNIWIWMLGYPGHGFFASLMLIGGTAINSVIYAVPAFLVAIVPVLWRRRQ